MPNTNNHKNISSKRLIFFICTSIVPFLLYSGYYYYKMVSKAPFKFAEFDYLEVSDNNLSGNTRYSFNSKTKDFKFFKNDQLTNIYKLGLAQEELHKIHRYLVENIFFDIPDQLGTNHNPKHIYSIKVCYQRKCKSVTVYDNVTGSYNVKINNIKRYLENKFKKL
ncbi:MAG: hypothetical protein ACQPRI_05815 [Solitalea-like symbiont of Tyrophagus putrescentiae]